MSCPSRNEFGATPPPCIRLLVVAQAAQAKTFAWKATGKGGTIYLMGSIHVMSQSFYPLNPALEAAFKDSDLLVEEVDLAQMLDPMAQMNILTRGMLPSNQSLDKVVSPARSLVQKRPPISVNPAGPLMRFSNPGCSRLPAGNGTHEGRLDPGAWLDQHFYDQAKDGGKAIRARKSIPKSRFDEMMMEQQDRMRGTLKELAPNCEVGKLGGVEGRRRRGIERMALADISRIRDMPSDAGRGRTRTGCRKSGAVRARQALVVVGAAHLVGPDGLIAMLKAKGYAIEQL